MSNDEGEALCSGISTAFNCAKDPNSGKIYTNGLVDAAITLLPVYDRIFGQSMVANVLKNDLSNSSSMVRAAYLKDPEGKNTIDKLITKELIETGIQNARKDKQSGIKNLLWLTRALDFMSCFLDNCILQPSFANKGATKAAQDAYATVLRPYHGIVVSQIVSMAFNLCPSREELERRLGFNDPTAVEGSVRNLLSLIRPVVEDVKEKLIQSDCNFPDKV